MNIDEIFRVFLARPVWQRVFFAFTLGVFMSCSMQVANPAPQPVIVGSLATP